MDPGLSIRQRPLPAVSYTHLDVYKRQIKASGTEVMEGKIDHSRYVEVATRLTEPVSYTHLDVYKRQKP